MKNAIKILNFSVHDFGVDLWCDIDGGSYLVGATIPHVAYVLSGLGVIDLRRIIRKKDACYAVLSDEITIFDGTTREFEQVVDLFRLVYELFPEYMHEIIESMYSIPEERDEYFQEIRYENALEKNV